MIETGKAYTHQVPKIDSIAFRNVVPGRYSNGKIKTIDIYGNPMEVAFEFHLYREVIEDVQGHLILRWAGNEQTIKVKYHSLYNLRAFLCPLGCKRYTTQLFYYDRLEWGCKKCLNLNVDTELMRARRLANHPDRLFALLRSAKRVNKRSIGFMGLFLLQRLFVRALKQKRSSTKGVKL